MTGKDIDFMLVLTNDITDLFNKQRCKVLSNPHHNFMICEKGASGFQDKKETQTIIHMIAKVSDHTEGQFL